MTVRPEYRSRAPAPVSRSTDSLADILERVLDKGIVIAGDIMVNVLDIELLTLKVRLLIASVDTARDMGIDWWSADPFLTGNSRLERENRELKDRLEELEQRMEAAGLPAGEGGAQIETDEGAERRQVGASDSSGDTTHQVPAARRPADRAPSDRAPSDRAPSARTAERADE